MELTDRSKKNSTVNPITDTLMGLKNRGYDLQLLKETSCLYCPESNTWIFPQQFNIDETYWFENLSNPDADRIVYAISSDVGIKGVLLDGLGVYADNRTWEMAEKLLSVHYEKETAFQKNKIKVYEYEQLRITHRRFN